MNVYIVLELAGGFDYHEEHASVVGAFLTERGARLVAARLDGEVPGSAFEVWGPVPVGRKSDVQQIYRYQTSGGKQRGFP